MQRGRALRRLVLGVAVAGVLLLASCIQLLPLDARIVVSPTATGYAPLAVGFDSTASTGAIASRTWNFGDPASGTHNLSTLPQAEHTFAHDGTYTVTLLVETADGEQDMVTTQIVVLNPPPVAQLQATPSHGPAPLTVTFDLSSSVDPAGIIPAPTGSIVSFTLSFGDGSNQSGSGAELATLIVHTYVTPEVRTATLTVLDDDGATATVSVPIVAEGIIESFAAPSYDPAGLTYDGSFLWLSDWKTGLIYRIRPLDGFVVATFEAPGAPQVTLSADVAPAASGSPAGIVPAPANPASPGGLAWGNGALWIACLSDGKIYKVNPHMPPSDPNHILAELENGAFDPFALAFGNGCLWVSDLSTGLIHKVNAQTGVVISSIPTPGTGTLGVRGLDPTGIQLIAPMGLAWDDGLLWVATGSTLYKLEPSSGDVIASIPSPGTSPFGLTTDGHYLWNADQNGTLKGRLYRMAAP
ncbi:PKD domain-containing protein [Candidatus Bipolaricaulota bacterium]